MLTHSPAAADGGHYYTEGKSRHEEERTPAAWFGTGAETLGLQGEITDTREFDAMLNGKLPGRTQLPNPTAGRERRHGDDWTFSPPKSVSITALVGGDGRLVEAHDRAVQAAARHMEKEMFGARAVVDGDQQHVTGGAVVGLFRHETSRPVNGTSDPQLHTHTVWVNASLRQDGEWRAADWALNDGAKLRADHVYLNALSTDLRRCGYELSPTKHAYEIKGVPQQAIGAFSRRAGQVENELGKAGKVRETASHEMRQTANLRTRKGKEQTTHATQVRHWQERAHEMGFDPERVVATARSHASTSTRGHEVATLENPRESPLGAARHHSRKPDALELTDTRQWAQSFASPRVGGERRPQMSTEKAPKAKTPPSEANIKVDIEHER
jgi:conjugative relaxase-like TrwC/TraI family protein